MSPHSKNSSFQASKVKTVTEFGINLTRIIPMETSESLAVVELHSAVGQIQGMQRRGESVGEILAEGKVEGCVLR